MYMTDKSQWKKVLLSDVAEEISTRIDNPSEAGYNRFVGLEHLIPGHLKVINWGSTENLISSMKAFSAGDTLFARRNVYLKRASMAGFDGLCSGDAIVLREREDRMVHGFLPLILNTNQFWDYAIANADGSMSKRINVKTLLRYEFSLPPADEQRRIAEILWTADEVVECYGKVNIELIALKESILGTIGKIENQQIYSLGDIVSYASDGPFGSKLKTEHYSSIGARVVRLQNIQAGYLNDSDKAYIPEEYYSKLIRYSLHPGDILIAGLGDSTYPVGRACLVPEYLGKAINKADCFCIRPNKKYVYPEYLCFYMNSKYAKKAIASITQGTTRNRINVGNLKKIKISLPALKKQKSLIIQLENIESVMNKNCIHLDLCKTNNTQLLSTFLNGGE